MADLKELKFTDPGIAQTLEDALADTREQDMEAVLIVMLPRSGGPILHTNRCSGFHKTFMVSFLLAWLSRWHFEPPAN